MRLNKRILGIMALLLLHAATSQAKTIEYIDFYFNNTGGSISSIKNSVDNYVLQGNNIRATGLTVGYLGGTEKEFKLSDDTYLNFTSDYYHDTTTNATTGATTHNFDKVNTVSFVKINGTIFDGVKTVATGDLLSSTSNIAMTVNTDPTNGPKIASSFFIDEKNVDFLKYIEADPNSDWNGALTIMFKGTADTYNNIQNSSSRIMGGIVGNTPTPIPAAAWLLGSGILGLIGVKRRNS